MMLGMIAAMATAFAAPQAVDGYQPLWSTPDQDVFAWQVEHIDAVPAAIVWADGSTTAAMERETLTREGGNVRAWFRWDALTAESAEQLTGRSVLVLREMDCSRRRSRVIAMSVYAGNNLTGSHVSADNPSADWQYDRPGMLGAAQTAAACDGTFLWSDEDVRRWIAEMSATK